MIRVLGKPEVVKKGKSIEITKEPDKTTYNAGDKFSGTVISTAKTLTGNVFCTYA